MKLVLLPGMDGTGMLFDPLVANIQGMEVVVLPLPTEGAQDYKALSQDILKRLPDEDFILVAESFSGGIAALLSQQLVPHLKGIIFVASFLSGPKKMVARFASLLPIRYLARLPFSGIVYRLFFLGKDAGNNEIELLRNAIDAVPTKTLKLRLKVIAQAKYGGFKSGVPAVYIGAANDMLVHPRKKLEFVQAYSDITFAELVGPHFILQAKPKEGATAIIEAVSLLTGQVTKV
ncbi:alpha-beta hydrolase superfamily lysophospholipase [Rheinheimera pacifica]|uniref:alpha/beta fold hydrolase n=1 Tax=Rheinheimera pacifica TaxID=173990 RepID=UPI002858DBC1|nr:hypothetical protein [Rheinheimera pacifica]MDR6983694.1 alpha-beta hydrolase superfamily lysophospholipase [Rheinheimera pacifica]